MSDLKFFNIVKIHNKTYQKFEVSNHVRSGPNFSPHVYIQNDLKHSRDITIHYRHVYTCYTHLIGASRN